jgi:hypothetical protein
MATLGMVTNGNDTDVPYKSIGVAHMFPPALPSLKGQQIFCKFFVVEDDGSRTPFFCQVGSVIDDSSRASDMVIFGLDRHFVERILFRDPFGQTEVRVSRRSLLEGQNKPIPISQVKNVRHASFPDATFFVLQNDIVVPSKLHRGLSVLRSSDWIKGITKEGSSVFVCNNPSSSYFGWIVNEGLTMAWYDDPSSEEPVQRTADTGISFQELLIRKMSHLNTTKVELALFLVEFPTEANRDCIVVPSIPSVGAAVENNHELDVKVVGPASKQQHATLGDVLAMLLQNKDGDNKIISWKVAEME